MSLNIQIFELIAGFILAKRTKGLSSKTVYYYQDELRRFSTYLTNLSINQIENITPDIIRGYLLKLAETRNKGGVHAAYRPIRAFFYWFDDEFEPDWKNPIRKIKVASPGNQPIQGVSMTNITRLLEVCNTSLEVRDRAILITLVDTGLRANELCGLNLSDINLVTGATHVHKGKGGKNRTVFMGQKCRKAVRKYLRTRDYTDKSPLFCNDENERLCYSSLVALIRRLATKAGIQTPMPHDFRRTFAVEMLRGGCDLARLADLMGHSSIEITRRYLYLLDSDLQEIHQRASPGDTL